MKKIYIGPAGWSYVDWKGIVYPSLKGGQSELAYLSRFFDIVEINSSFYRIPTERHALSWLDQVKANPDFLFAVKLWQGFTHTDVPPDSIAELEFKKALDVLLHHGKLAALLLQFPWRFKQNAHNLEYIDRLINQFKDYFCCIEFRHNSWNTKEICDFLINRGVCWVNIDQPVIGESISPGHVVTANLGYVRLHGRNYEHWFDEKSGRDDRYNYLYVGSELQPWVHEIKAISEQCDRTIVIFNNHFRGQAVVNSLQMSAMLLQQPVLVPSPLTKHFPELADIAKFSDNGETLSLF